MSDRKEIKKRRASQRVEMRHLHYFVAAAQASHFGRAAQRLNVSTPSVSRQVRELEELLDVVLFDRLPRGVELSQSGHLFLQEVLRLLGDIDETLGRVIDGYSGEAGSLKIGINDAASWSGTMPNSIRHFRAKYPKVKLELLPMSSSAALEAVLAGEIHLAFVHPLAKKPGTLRYQDVETNRVMLAVHEQNRLARKKTLRLADLRSEPFVLLSRQPNAHYYDELLENCARGALTPNVLQEVHKEASLLALVSTGMAVGWVVEPAELRRPTGVVLRDVADFSMTMTLALIWRHSNRSSLVARFAEVVAEQGRSKSA